MTTLENLIDRYCEGWSAESESERERLIRGSLANEAIYTDPRTNRLQISDLLAHISKIHLSRPGAIVRRTSNVDAHHGFARFNWCVVMQDGNTLPEGLDVIELSADGTRIRSITGFFGPLLALSKSDA